MTWDSSVIPMFADPMICEAFCNGVVFCIICVFLFHLVAGAPMILWEVVREVFHRKGWIRGGDNDVVQHH